MPCDNKLSLFHGIPYIFYPLNDTTPLNPVVQVQDNTVRFWTHIGLLILGFLIAAINFIVQLCRPASYGKHTPTTVPCPVPTRLFMLFAQFTPGLMLVTVTYFLSGNNFLGIPNIVLYSLFTVHYLFRGLIQPLLSRQSHSKVSAWIPLGMLLANTVYHFTVADFIGSAFYCKGYYYDPRFMLGVLIFLTGLIINWASDIQLILLRSSRQDKDYLIPRGPLFVLISCPNYFGECIEWLGWAIATWSLSGLIWWLYVLSTLVPRAGHNHSWYRQQFMSYPHKRRAFIPFLY